MGPALYFDLRCMHLINKPLSQEDIVELRRIHNVVTMACVGLWASGLALIWIRTNFDFAQFSPKLWSKVIVVSVLSLNAMILNTVVIPVLARNTGIRLADLPLTKLVPMTLCAGVSLSCWLLALALGASSILKVSGWDILLPVMLGGAALCIGAALGIAWLGRTVVNRAGAQRVPH